MESQYDPWSEQPLDLVKRKVPVPADTPSAMVVSINESPRLAEVPGSKEEYYLNEEDGTFYTCANKTATEQPIEKEEITKKFVLKVPTIKQEPTDILNSISDGRTKEPQSENQSVRLNLEKLLKMKKEDLKFKPDAVQSREGRSVLHDKPEGDRQKKMSKIALQSPNLYSALCLNKSRSESLTEASHQSVKKPQLPETVPKDPAAMSAAYLEVFDKLMADYVKKLNAQGSLDNIENTVEGINLVLNNLAAYEQKLLSAMYMGNLLNSQFPNMYHAAATINPFLSTTPGVGPLFNPVLHPGFPLGLVPHASMLPPGMTSDLLGGQPSHLLSAASAYQNALPTERTSSTPMSPPSSSPASVSSSTNPSATSSMQSNRLGPQEPLLRVKDFQQWRPSNDRQSSTPTSSLTSLATTTDLSNEESMSLSISSVRSSSVSSCQNLTLSPLSSVGASPPLSSKSDSHSRSQLLNFSRSIMDHQKNSGSNSDGSKGPDSGNGSNNQEKKKPHIKKPLNAFMLYMKEMRQQVVSECTLKESAAINQILGRRWHSLSREEQGKYYEKARQERQLHMQLYPAWSARDNYGYGAKKKKRKKERVPVDTGGGNNMKKCRARYGLDQQSQWCKPCRRKKKCIRYMEAGGGGGGDDGNQSDDNLGSCGSVGEGDAHTPVNEDEDGDESMSQSHSLSSPGGLSGLSSLTSPSMILPSPSTSLASPSVSLASPCMSLQSPLTPLEYECKPPLPLPLPLPLPMYNHHQSPLLGPPLHRHPVGTNPHDINNPLSVNQLTGKCIKTETNSTASSGSSASVAPGPGPSTPAPAPSNIIRVT